MDIYCIIYFMNLQRAVNPEISNDIEISKSAQHARIAGGYLLGLAGYGLGLMALLSAGPSAGLSIPAFGALSAASYAGSRTLMRPAFQNDQEYVPVQVETTKQKIGRYALFGLGIVGFNAGANLITGGLFNAYQSSIGAGYRVASVIGGYFTAKYGTRAVRGSFDPKLHSDEPLDLEKQQRSLFSIINESLNGTVRSTRPEPTIERA